MPPQFLERLFSHRFIPFLTVTCICKVTFQKRSPKTAKTHVASGFSAAASFSSDEDGAPEEIRTPDLMVRSHALYPAELRAQIYCWFFANDNYSTIDFLVCQAYFLKK